jgi:major membrane immunogen (membrane-anchored lipoprotein)
MRKKYFSLIAIIVSTLCFLACDKGDKGFVTAKVFLADGDISKGGCGYLLELEDGTMEKPYQLLSLYQHNGLLVKVKYHYSDKKDTCGSSKPQSRYDLVIIDDIKMAAK